MANCKNKVKPKQIDIEALIEIIKEELEIDSCFSFPFTRLDMGVLCLPLESWDEIDAGEICDETIQKFETLDFGELCE